MVFWDTMLRLYLFCVLLLAPIGETTDEGTEETRSNYTCHLKIPGEILCDVDGVKVPYENKADEVVCVELGLNLLF